MPRHARNCTAGSVYTYHEKVKDAQQSGYGTQSMRLGKDSIKVGLKFYCHFVGLLNIVRENSGTVLLVCLAYAE